jgi:hypothetical protein
MPTAAAARALEFADWVVDEVHTRRQLVRIGLTPHAIDANLAARRWQRLGHAIVLHNGPLTREQRWRVGVLNAGPRAVLASFSATEQVGLRDWEREEVHVLAPAGVAPPRIPGIPVVLHRTTLPIPRTGGGLTQLPAAALVLAAASFRTARPACGILAAGVQQRLVSAAQLAETLHTQTRVRHRAALVSAVGDIAMGAEALSEIDFARLCRRYGLPAPRRQSVRVDRHGRRRYLDAEWVRPDGRRVVVEIDGALHLTPLRWYDDQLRQNEVVLDGSIVLRFPSVVMRTEEALVVAQLHRALFGS